MNGNESSDHPRGRLWPLWKTLIGWHHRRGLRRTLAHARRHSPFYRTRIGLDVGTLADLRRTRFFTTAADLTDPANSFLAVPEQEVFKLWLSSATTDHRKTIAFTRRDWVQVTRTVAFSMWSSGIGKGDVALVLYDLGTPSWVTGQVLVAALERRGICAIAGKALSPREIFDLIRSMRVDAIFSTPSMLRHLMYSEEGDLRHLGIRSIFLGGEPWGESFRGLIRERWGCTPLDTYGMTETGGATAAELWPGRGLFVSADLLVEVIDPESGQPVGPGETGEVVITTLGRKGTPLIRYRTSDVATLLESFDGATGPALRISRIIGRNDDTVIVGMAALLNPDDLERVLDASGSLGLFQLVVEDASGADRLRLRVESAQPSDELRQRLRSDVLESLIDLRYDLEVTHGIRALEIEWLPPGTLQRENPVKLRRVIDRRDRSRLVEDAAVLV